MDEQVSLLSKRATTTLYKVNNWQSGRARGHAVVLKVLDNENPGVAQLGRFLHELEISKLLEDRGVVGVRRGHERTRHQGRHALVLDFVEGAPLSTLSTPQTLDQVMHYLSLASQVATTLAKMHEAGGIHRDIKPANILVSQNDAITVIDFGQASLLDVRSTELGNPTHLDGTLLYMSPEQTGRMNRTVDYRTDLYSLGATLYQLLTGRTPFVSEDPLELVHCHLAKLPVAPHLYNPVVPPQVSGIVLRLLEKNPADRYQSAAGLASDLNATVSFSRAGSTLDKFILGRGDAPTRFTVVEKLYGRESQEQALLASFQRVQAGGAELVCIAGPSGVGKSALVGQVYKPMTERRGNAARGKFDQLSRSVPYSALTRAFSDLISLLLTHDDHALSQYRESIRSAVGDLGGVLLNLMPNLPLIVGDLPTAPPLEGTAAQHRLQWVMRAFVRSIASEEHPLVLFIDDVQWADSASLDLLQSILVDPFVKHLLLIAAYRDNEITPTHPLHDLLHAVKAVEVPIVVLSVDNLTVSDVAAMVADSTKANLEEAESLAKVVHEKTRGNAFFVHQFLSMLSSKGLLTFDTKRSRWVWQPEAIAAVSVTENVADLLTQKLRALDTSVQQLLQQAASVGNRFDLAIMAELTRQPRVTVGRSLVAALAAGLITPVGRGYLNVEAASEFAHEVNAEYSFAHDRVQQAAYALCSEEEQKKIHLEAARILWRSLGNASDSKVFEVVRHLAAARGLITDVKELREAASLELRAGRLAMTAGAYRQSLEHAERGLALLPPNSWENYYETTSGLHLLASQVAALDMVDSRVRKAADEVLAHAKTGLERASVYSDLALVAMAREDLTGAVSLGVSALAELGVNFPSSPATPHIVASLLRTKMNLWGKVEELANNKPLQDPRVEAALMIMDRLLPAAFRSGSKLFPLFVFEMVRLANNHGLSKYSVAAYTSYAIAQCAVLKDYDLGYRFAKTALTISERYPRAMGAAVFNIFIRHWKEPLVNTVEGLRQAARLSFELGDLYQATWSSCYSTLFMFVSGAPLTKVLESYGAYGDALLFDEGAVGMRKMVTQIISNLTVPSTSPHKLEGVDYNEAWVLRRFHERNDATEIGQFRLYSLLLCVLFGETKEGLIHADEIEKHVDGLNPMFFWVLMHFLSAIVRLRAFSSEGEKNLLSKAKGNYKVLQQAAKQNPQNYVHMAAAVEALIASVEGKREARTLFENAIELARRNDVPSQDQALILELACHCCRKTGDNQTADSLRDQAAQEYLAWGAVVLHDRLVGTVTRPSRADSVTSSFPSRSTRSMSTSGNESSLDLMSVMKASQAISGALVLEELLEQLVYAMIQNAGAGRGLLILNADRPLAVEAFNTTAKASFSETELDNRNDLAKTVIRYVERTKETVVITDSSTDPRFSSDPYFSSAKPMSVLCLPIQRQKRLVGTLYLENTLSTNVFTSARCEFLELLSVQAAISLENAMLYDTLDSRVKAQTVQLRESLKKLEETQAVLHAELADAAAFVRSLLPQPLTSGQIQTSWRYVPSAHLGGDGLGYLFLDDGRFAFFVLDVAGHGLASALLCISIMTALHSKRIPGADFADPTSVLRGLNTSFPLSTGGRPFTMWYGVLDPKTGELVCANGGHPSALVGNGKAPLREVGDPGVMLGVLPDVDFALSRTVVEPGEIIFLFSDGVYELLYPDGKVLDYDEFTDKLHSVALDPLAVEHMLKYATTVKQATELDDDFTMLRIERKG